MQNIKDIIDSAKKDYEITISNSTKYAEKIKNDARNHGQEIIKKSKNKSSTLIQESVLKSKNILNEAQQTWDHYKAFHINSIQNLYENNIRILKNKILYDINQFVSLLHAIESQFDKLLSEITDEVKNIDNSIKNTRYMMTSVFTENIAISRNFFKKIYHTAEIIADRSIDNIKNIIISHSIFKGSNTTSSDLLPHFKLF